MTVIMLLALWCVLSVPVGLVTASVLARRATPAEQVAPEGAPPASPALAVVRS